MAIGDDFSVAANGDVRHVSGSTIYDILDLHAWLQDLADNAAPSGDDNLSILSANPSKMDGPRDALVATRLNLLGTVNIDDTASQSFKFGSVKQSSGNVLYAGVRTIGGIVAASPMYVVQNATKLTKFWADGHIQILVKVKDAGTLIDSGDIQVYSRKYGQTYGYFAANLAAGGESAAAVSTESTTWTTLNEAGCAALEANITLQFYGAATQHDLGNGNGARDYWGKITLSGGITVAQAAQVLQYMCREATTSTFNTVPGWRYRALRSGYTPEAKAPFGEIIGGKWYVAQGWWLDGYIGADAQNYVLKDDLGVTQTPPNVVAITIGGLLSGDRVLVGRDNGSGGFLEIEYNLAAGNDLGNNTIVIQEAIKTDTPTAGVVRIGSERYTYTGWSTSTFTGVSPTLSQSYALGTDCWVPFFDDAADATSETVTFIYSANFTGRVKVRQGSGGTPIQPFETTFSVGTAGGGTNAIRNNDV